MQGVTSIGIFWLLHSLLWNGKAETIEDLPFPLNVVAPFIGGELVKKSYQTDFEDNLGYVSDFEDNNIEEKLATQSLGRISINGLINWLLSPEGATFNFLISLFFVSTLVSFTTRM